MKKLTVILAAALAIVSCAKQESVRPVQQGEVRFTTNIQTYTVKATDTAFENNDQIGIFAGAPISKNNVKAVVTGTSLIPVTPIKWVPENNDVVEFVAYYPYAEAATLTDYVFEVQSNQSTAANYTKSDLMLAKKSSAPTENAVELAFSHALSKVVINLTNSVPETTVSRVEFEGVAMSAKVNLSTGAVSELGAAGTITANAAASAYQLILLPQSASPKVNVFLSNGNKYTYELASAFTFKAGKKASAALVVNPQQEAGVVEFSFSVSDWEVDADALEFGDPTVEAGVPDHTWSVIGLGGDWDTDIPMVLTDGKWTATINYTEGDEFKLRADGAWDLSAGIKSNWENQVFIAGDNPDPYLEENSPRNIKLEATGEYKLQFQADTYHFVVTKIGGASTPSNVWAVVGLASDWNTEHEMTQDAEDPNLWTITVTLGAEDAEKNGFKFRIKGATSWETQFGAPAAPDNEFEITEADQKINLVANDSGSANIIIKPFASIYDFKLYVDGDKKGELYVTKH